MQNCHRSKPGWAARQSGGTPQPHQEPHPDRLFPACLKEKQGKVPQKKGSLSQGKQRSKVESQNRTKGGNPKAIQRWYIATKDEQMFKNMYGKILETNLLSLDNYLFDVAKIYLGCFFKSFFWWPWQSKTCEQGNHLCRIAHQEVLLDIHSSRATREGNCATIIMLNGSVLSFGFSFASCSFDLQQLDLKGESQRPHASKVRTVWHEMIAKIAPWESVFVILTDFTPSTSPGKYDFFKEFSVTFLAGHGEICLPHGWSTWRPADQPTPHGLGAFLKKTIQEIHVDRRVVGWSAGRHVITQVGGANFAMAC